MLMVKFQSLPKVICAGFGLQTPDRGFKKPKLGKAKNALPQKRGKLRGIRGGDPAIC